MAEQAGACGLDLDERRRLRYGGLHIYVSHNRAALKDDGLRKWARNVLTRFDGVEVVLKERRHKDPPSCPACWTPVATCPACKASMHRSAEKGMDTAIVTDMIRLAWEGRWDLAVLVSGDGDFVRAVEALKPPLHEDADGLLRIDGTRVET